MFAMVSVTLLSVSELVAYSKACEKYGFAKSCQNNQINM